MKSSFFDAVYSAEGYDRTYTSADWADYFRTFISNGVFAQSDTSMQVVADTGMSVKVSEGSCFINGRVAYSEEDTVTLDIGDTTFDRYDAVTVRLDLEARNIHASVIKGTPARTPAKPEPVRTSNKYDLVLAYVLVPAGTLSLRDSYIYDKRFDETLCGIVKGLVSDIKTGELFKQYEEEWETLIATAELDEPAIIAKFNELIKAAKPKIMPKHVSEIFKVY